MQRAPDNRQRAYQTVRNIMVARPWWGSSPVAYSGQKLDNMLKSLGLPPRKTVDEPAV